MREEIRQNFFGFMIIAFESGAANSPNPEQDTCHYQSIWYEILLLFNISVRAISFESVSLTVI